jgi:hypothetical protein
MEVQTERGYSEPSVHQFSVFLENRVGILRQLIQRLESTEVKIVALSVLDTADSAVVRFVFDDADKARDVLDRAGRAYSECELVAVQLSPGQGLLQILSTLLEAEINLHYAYSMMQDSGEGPALALHVDDRQMAIRALRHKGFRLLDQSEI